MVYMTYPSIRKGSSQEKIKDGKDKVLPPATFQPPSYCASFLFPFQEAGSNFSGSSRSKKHSSLFHVKKKKTFLIQCLHWTVVLVLKTVKKGGLTLSPMFLFHFYPVSDILPLWLILSLCFSDIS